MKFLKKLILFAGGGGQIERQTHADREKERQKHR